MENDEITTIKLRKKTKNRLNNLKIYKRETYDEALERVLELLNSLRISPEEAKKKLIDFERKKQI